MRTRAECAAAIAIAVAEGRGIPNGGCYLDLTQNAKGRAREVYRNRMCGVFTAARRTQRMKRLLMFTQWQSVFLAEVTDGHG